MRKRDLLVALGGAVGAAVAVKMLTRADTVDWEDVRELVPHSDHSRFAAVDGIKLHYQEFGDAAKPAILLIHGYRSSSLVWRTSAPAIAESGFHVIAVDLAGFGYSDKPRWFEYSITAQARLLSRFMERVGIGRATVVGSSYGGAVAATIALDYPERVDKLVLTDAVINDNLKSHPLLRLAAVPGLGEAIAPFVADSRSLLRGRMHRTLAKPNHHLINEERVENVLRPLRAADAHHSLLVTSRNWHADRIEQDAHLIRQSTLIIWGEDDTVTPVTDGYKLQDAIEDSRFVVLKDCGHVPQEERAETFSKLVVDFCRGRKSKLKAIRADDEKLAG
jgi:pimeloyl-ACP methyl ester carboxylesterase